MTLGFDIELADLLAYNRYHITHDKVSRRRIYIWQILIPIIYAGAIILQYGLSGMDKGVYIFGIIWIFLMPVFIVWMSQWSARRMYKRPENKRWLGPREMTFNETGIIYQQESDRSEYAWNSLVKWAEVPKYFFVYITGMTGYIIPKRAATPEQQNQLRVMFEGNIIAKTKK